MSLIRDRGRLYLLGLCVCGVGFIIFLVGFSTPNWTEWALVNQGLWRQCVDTVVSHTCTPFYTDLGPFIAVRVLECLALCGFVIFGLLIVLQNFTSSCKKHAPSVDRVIGFVGILSSLIGTVGVIVYAVEYIIRSPMSKWAGWSLTVTEIGLTLVFIGTILMLISRPTHRPTLTIVSHPSVTYQNPYTSGSDMHYPQFEPHHAHQAPDVQMQPYHTHHNPDIQLQQFSTHHNPDVRVQPYTTQHNPDIHVQPYSTHHNPDLHVQPYPGHHNQHQPTEVYANKGRYKEVPLHPGTYGYTQNVEPSYYVVNAPEPHPHQRHSKIMYK